MKKLSIILTAIFFILFLTACRYDEGPMISFRSVEKRVAQSFLLVEFTKNGVDMTQELTDSCGNYWRFSGSKDPYQPLTFVVEGSIHITNNYVPMGGDWKLSNNKKQIELNTTHNFEGLGPFQNNIITTWKIERLTKDEMWLSCTYNNAYYYIKFEVK
jgi:hypothetical protein